MKKLICPNCGNDTWITALRTLTTNPLKTVYRCANCDHETTVLIPRLASDGQPCMILLSDEEES